MATVTLVADWSTYGTVTGSVIIWPPGGAPTVVPITANAMTTPVPANITGGVLLYGVAFADMTIGGHPAIGIPQASISIPATTQTIDLLTAISPSPLPVRRPILGGFGGSDDDIAPDGENLFPRVSYILGTLGNKALRIADVASAQNYVGLANRPAGNAPYFFVDGPDTDISFGISAKGAGRVLYQNQELATQFDRATNAYNWRASNTRKLRAGLSKAIAGKGSTNHVVIGDSVSAGYLGGSSSPTADVLAAWPEIYRAHLSAAGIPVGGTGMCPCIKGDAQYDTRWTLGAAWNVSLAYTAFTTTSGTTATFVADRTGTAVSVYYYGTSTAMKVNIDGGADIVLSFTGTNVPNVRTITGLSDAAHTVVITTTAATYNQLIGASVHTPGVGLNVHNVAVGGARAHSSTDFLAAWDRSDAIYLNQTMLKSLTDAAGITPDCVFVALGGNDIQDPGFNVVNTFNAIAGLRTQFASSDFVIIAQNEFSGFETNGALLRTYLYLMADVLNVPLIDMFDRFGPYTTANADGLMGDTAHPNSIGQADMGRNLAGLVMK